MEHLECASSIVTQRDISKIHTNFSVRVVSTSKQHVYDLFRTRSRIENIMPLKPQLCYAMILLNSINYVVIFQYYALAFQSYVLVIV